MTARRVFTRDRIASAVREHRGRGELVTYAALGREIGCCSKWVAIIVRRMDANPAPLRRYRRWTPERLAVLVGLIDAGYQISRVARWADIDAAYLWRVSRSRLR